MFLAHSRNRQGQAHLLVDHLTEAAKLAREFAPAFGAGELGYYAGLWHDLGKFNLEFQEHLHRCDTNPVHPPATSQQGALQPSRELMKRNDLAWLVSWGTLEWQPDGDDNFIHFSGRKEIGDREKVAP